MGRKRATPVTLGYCSLFVLLNNVKKHILKYTKCKKSNRETIKKVERGNKIEKSQIYGSDAKNRS